MASLPTAVRSTAPKIARSALQQRRAISDVHITRTGKALIRNTGGRSVAPVSSLVESQHR
jgi:NADH dehydrogenase (ubiquinone) 1 alpha subcomplex subunit 9